MKKLYIISCTIVIIMMFCACGNGTSCKSISPADIGRRDVLPSGVYEGYLIADGSSIVEKDGVRYLKIMLEDIDPIRYSKDELLGYSVGDTFVYDDDNIFEIDRLEFDEDWHDMLQDESNDYQRLDGRICMSDRYFFIHPACAVDPATGYISENLGEASLWILATDDDQDGIRIGTKQIWMPLSDSTIFFRDLSEHRNPAGVNNNYSFDGLEEYLEWNQIRETRVRCIFKVYKEQIIEFDIQT